MSWLGTAMRCCCKYSESSGLRSESGFITLTSDFWERLPVCERCMLARLVLVVLYC